MILRHGTGRCRVVACIVTIAVALASCNGGSTDDRSTSSTRGPAALAGIDVPGYEVLRYSGTDGDLPGIDKARVGEFADDVEAYRITSDEGAPVGGMFVFALKPEARAVADVAAAYAKGVSGGDDSKVQAADSNGVRVLTVEDAAGLDHIVFTSNGNRFLYDVFGDDGAAVRRFLGELGAR